MNNSATAVSWGNTPIIATTAGTAATGIMKYLEIINSVGGTLVIVATLVAGIITSLKYWAEKKKADAETERIHLENEQRRLENHEQQVRLEAGEIEQRLEKTAVILLEKLHVILEKKK